MSSLIRRFRGLGVALAVLAISAGAVFASTPAMRPSASASAEAKTHATSALPTSATDPTDKPEATETAEPTDTPEPTDAAAPAAASTPNPDTHGALVSTAAQMPTPTGFPNHGAFVSCVAHLNASLTGFDWTTVTPAFCGITSTAAPHGHASANGATHGAAGQARGAAARQQHAPTTGH